MCAGETRREERIFSLVVSSKNEAEERRKQPGRKIRNVSDFTMEAKGENLGCAEDVFLFFIRYPSMANT